MAWKFTTDKPIYLQIVQQIKLRIISGEYLPSSQLPTVRQLADEISVNPNTVQKAMLQLEKEGLVYSQATVGRFIKDDLQLPDQLLEKLAEQKTRDFISSMKAIGLDTPKAIALIEKTSKEDNHDN